MGEIDQKLRANYIFIDYENVQPSSFTLVGDLPFKVFLFVGANQTKIPMELVKSMHALGENAEYVEIEGNGKNALDFHIAFYIGRIFEKDQSGYFHIISKDTGFDVLIKHLRSKKVLIQRHNQIADIPLLKISNSKTLAEKIDSIVSYLISRGNAKPRKVATLKNAINSLFYKTLASEEVEKLIQELVLRKLIAIDDSKVVYKLTAENA